MWNKLETFYYIIKAGSVSEAAKQLNMNQSSLSRSLMSLEDRIGYKLCVRTKTGVELTRKGQKIFEAAGGAL